MTPSRRRHHSQRCLPALIVTLFLLPAIAVAGHAPKPDAKPAAKADTKPAPAPVDRTPSAGPAGGVGAAASHMGAIAGLPHYEEPAAYSVDLVIRTTEGKDMVMHRFVDRGRVRTDMSVDGTDMSMIELGDEKGTTYMLMPEEKRAIKQSREAMSAMVAKSGQKAVKVEAESHQPDAKVEDLGEETIDGRVVKKMRMTMADGSALGWFDKATGAPVKMESVVEGNTASIEWKNMKPGPPPASVYEIPKGYEVTDMDEMMAKMKTMGGMPGMSSLGGIAGMPGMTGGMKGVAGGMGQQFGSQMGASLGGTLGASLGGPLGAMAGQYIGGKIGGAIGKKAAETVVPGK